MRNTFKFLIAILVVMLCYIVLREVHVCAATVMLDPAVVEELRSSARTSLPSGDVPVGAVLLFGERVIGHGGNTVLKDNNAGGHAEINAVSNALVDLGMAAFNDLDRDSLTLITTFEPCAMCRGMISEYRIEHVVYNEPKSLLHWMHDDFRWLRYELTKRIGGHNGLQDSLFKLHPAYQQ